MQKVEDVVKQYSKLEELNKRNKKEINLISTIRLIAFVAIIIFGAVGIYDSNYIAFVISFMLLVGFIALIIYHKGVLEHFEYVEARLKVLDRYIKRFGDDWKSFEDTGKEFLDKDDTVAMDLDLLGKHSIYQLICCAHTSLGRARLGKTLSGKNVNRDIATINKRNVAIEELVKDENYAVNFETLSFKMSEGKKYEDDSSTFIEFCKDKTKTYPIWMNVIRILMPIICMVLIVGVVFFKVSFSYLVIYFIVMIGISWLTNGITSKYISPMFRFVGNIEGYIYMFDVIATSTFESEMLVELRENIIGEGNVTKALRSLNSIGNSFNLRYNPIIHQFLCGTILWDFQISAAMYSWKNKYGDYIEKWIDSVAIMEELISLSVIGKIRETTSAEVTVDNTPNVICENIYHPLIKNLNVVANSIKVNGETIIITGSNMSGKTTFLRTIGINMVLAYCGAPVCADRFKTSLMKLYTSMRVVDDISNGISTFYAEILRIKEMITSCEEDGLKLCLIDEIFKGTNSADRIVGARVVIEKLSNERCATFVSTHDFELCDMEKKYKNIKNYHFEEFYEEDSIKFDYLLKIGRCTTTNAMKLLEMSGIK